MMKQEALFKKIGNILSELNEQYAYLSQHTEQLNELELDLFLANIKFLSDHTLIVKKLCGETLTGEVDNNMLTTAENVEEIKENVSERIFDFKVDKTENAIIETPIVEDEVETLNAKVKPFDFLFSSENFSDDLKFDFEEKSADELFDRPLSKEEERILASKRNKNIKDFLQSPIHVNEDEVGPEPFLVAEIKEEVVAELSTAEKLNSETLSHKPSINDLIGQKSSTKRVNDAAVGVVKDLKAAISLNDKLLYIKDLFNGYNLAYAEAIDLANKMTSFDAADNFFQKNYAEKNAWADKQQTVDKFYLLLNKRFRD